jgi:L-lactate dehydrogenase complex protein LldE
VRVHLFATCLLNEFMAGAGMATARLLQYLGVDVEVPVRQTCCGQPAFNAGYDSEARRMALHTIETFEAADHVVLPSGSCAAMVRQHYTHLFEGSDAARAAALSAKTWELTQFVVRVLGINSLGDGLRDRRIAWHAGCHALRDLQIRDEPITLLRNAGAQIVEWQAAEECCGFGGLFSVKYGDVSVAMADRKLDTLPATPDLLVSGDGGCLMHLDGRIRKRGLDLPVRHIAEVLLEAVQGPEVAHGRA